MLTHKFHMPDHIVEDVSRFGAHSFIYASPFEHFNYVVEIFIKVMSMRRDSML